jgi:hypothetical protein
VNVEHALALIDAVDRALPDAGLIQEIDSVLRDDIGQPRPPRRRPEAIS